MSDTTKIDGRDVLQVARRSGLIFGSADSVGERTAKAVGMGLDGITVDSPSNGHNPERTELLGQLAQRALR